MKLLSINFFLFCFLLHFIFLGGKMEEKDPNSARPTANSPTVEQADDDGNRSQQLNQRMKRATHDGHPTEGASRNHNSVSGSPLKFHTWILHVSFDMYRRGRTGN